MNKNLKIKDLVIIGVFFVMYMVVHFGVGFAMRVALPILFLVYPAVAGIITGPIVILFMQKVHKPWALLIFGMLEPLLLFAMGHTYVLPLVSLIFVGLAEFVFRKGGFKSFKHMAIANGFLACWISGSLMQILIVHDKYLKLASGMGMSNEYINALEKLISWPSMGLVIVGAFAGGIIGALIGKKMLKKHFEKAGIA